VIFTAGDDGLPDAVAVVRKTNPDALLDIIERTASVRALREH